MSNPITDAQYRYLMKALNDERGKTAKVYITEYCEDPIDLTRQQAFVIISALENKYNPDAPVYHKARV